MPDGYRFPVSVCIAASASAMNTTSRPIGSWTFGLSGLCPVIPNALFRHVSAEGELRHRKTALEPGIISGDWIGTRATCPSTVPLLSFILILSIPAHPIRAMCPNSLMHPRSTRRLQDFRLPIYSSNEGEGSVAPEETHPAPPAEYARNAERGSLSGGMIQRPTGARGGYSETAGRIIRERFNNSQDRVTARLASASCFVDKQRASLAVSSLNWLS